MKIARIFTMLVITALAALCFSASALAAVTLPKGTKEIGDEAFSGVPLPKYFAIRSGVEKIGSGAFAGTGVVQFWLPKTLKEIAPDAFDESATFVCSPGTYAEQWCEENKADYDYIKPSLHADKTSLLYGETAVLTANYVFNDEATEYFWETRGRERYWTPLLDENGPVLRYTNSEGEGYTCFRVSAICGDDEISLPSNCVVIKSYGSAPEFLPDKCKALSGDSVYLEWTFMGKEVNYILLQWFPDAQNPAGGEWAWIDSFKGGWNYTVYGLEKNTEYKFQIGIVEDGEANILSKPFAITTGEEPTILKMNKPTMIGNSFHMSWEPIKNAVYDSYFGYDQNNMRLFSSNLWATEYHLYNTSKTKNSYVQIRARIPNTGFVFWGPICEIEANSEEPVVEIESCEMKGDILNLSWKTLPGCIYDVYLHMDGEEEFCAIKDTSKTAIEYGGFRPGEHGTVRVVAKFGGWAKSSDEVEISVPLLNEVEYRALLIGEVSFKGSMYSGRCYGDVELLAKMLENVKTPDGTFYSVIRRKDLNRQQVFAAIQEAFGTADENDVSLIYFGTHGDVSHVGRLAGSLCTVEVPNKTYDVILMEELAAALKEVKGTKIVWLGSCGSGAGIYDKNEEENIADPYYGEYDEDEWDGWYEYEINDDFYTSDLSEAETFDTGELRLPDFQVMTAARYRFVSWGNEAKNYTFFIHFLTEGVCGPDGSMPADLNGDGRLTQHELFLYINERMEDPESGSDQDIQAYPLESDYVLFTK